MATDQEIRDAGLLYIPKQKYLQNPYNLPIAPDPVAPVPGGITNTNAFNNSGGNNFKILKQLMGNKNTRDSFGIKPETII